MQKIFGIIRILLRFSDGLTDIPFNGSSCTRNRDRNHSFTRSVGHLEEDSSIERSYGRHV